MKNSYLPFVATALTLALAAPASAAPTCDITFRITTSTALRSVSVFVNYNNIAGEFPGSSVDVDCDLLTGTPGETADADQSRTLTITAAGTPNPISTPTDFATCTWIPSGRIPVAGDFDLTAQSGFDTSFPVPGQVNAGIIISDISCDGVVTTSTSTSSSSTTSFTTTTTTTSTTSTSTSTSSTTTTTLGPSCGDINGDGVVMSSDALFILRAAIDLVVCDDCLCDTNGGGTTTVVDALVTLARSVNAEIDLDCPPCTPVR